MTDPIFKPSEITKRCGNTRVAEGKIRKLQCP